MFAPDIVRPAVEFLAGLAVSGSALEFGIGTGRIELPLSRNGVRVHGIELSPAMVTRFKEKPGADEIDVTIGDFSTATRFSLVYLVYNLYLLIDGTCDVISMPFRYVWPSELDLMARLARMTFRERWDEWTREPYTADSSSHVSVWQKR